MTKTSNQIRRDFLEFFRSKGHEVVTSSSLVPGNDPTLLFTNAGMVQFKDVFLGAEKRSYTRAASSQRCVRAGGKHNDLDQVGYTARHHTFFEMLGNFSFGDYFKRDAILYAWELLTGVWGLPKDRLLVTVYHTDDEAYDLWHKEVGLPADRIIRIGDNKGAPYASDNFWQMADTGPCGPCTEIFYDHGAHIAGGPPGSPDEDGDRFIEIWNNVFMQYDRQPDGTLVPLPAPCVDTGMGLERVSAVLQHVHSNYEIDLFQHLIKAAAALTGTADLEHKSLRVIADHIRACSFLVVDGVLPSNEGRGYVLRRIIRRAIRHGHKLGAPSGFFGEMVQPLVDVMGDAYPELTSQASFVTKVLKSEEEKFRETLDRGMAHLERMLHPRVPVMRYLAEKFGWENYGLEMFSSTGLHFDGVDDRKVDRTGVRLARTSESAAQELQELVYLLSELKDDGREDYKEVVFVVPDNMPEAVVTKMQAIASANTTVKVTIVALGDAVLAPYKTLSGSAVFRLYDTYGFPVDMTADVAREAGFVAETEEHKALMEQQKERARAAGKFSGGASVSADLVAKLRPTEFLGYETCDADNCRIVALLRDGKSVDAIASGDEAIVLLDRTPFYAESGGQVGDVGVLLDPRGDRFEVRDTVKLSGAFHGHVGRLASGNLKLGDRLSGRVDAARRQATVLNHSATHLLHAALRKVLGEHVTQKGSLVAPDRLRFDFSHFQAIPASDLARIEALVNAEIRRNAEAEVHHMGMQEALDFGAMALFGEKYGEHVRVLRMGDFSTELCGGTHVHHTGDIGLFKIVSEGGVAAGVRRIEAVTGEGALAYIAEEERRLDEAAHLLGGNTGDVIDKLRQLLDRQKKLERELESLKAKAAAGATADLAASAPEISGIKVVAARLEGLDAKALRDVVDQLKSRLGDAVIVLASAEAGKAALVAGVQGKAAGKVKAGELLSHVAAQIGGKGGGRPDMAQGGGPDGPALVAALEGVRDWVSARLG